MLTSSQHAAGSHTVLVLLEHGATVTLIDNLSNSFPRVFDHMNKLAGDKASKMKYVQVRTSVQEKMHWSTDTVSSHAIVFELYWKTLQHYCYAALLAVSSWQPVIIGLCMYVTPLLPLASSCKNLA